MVYGVSGWSSTDSYTRSCRSISPWTNYLKMVLLNWLDQYCNHLSWTVWMIHKGSVRGEGNDFWSFRGQSLVCKKIFSVQLYSWLITVSHLFSFKAGVLHKRHAARDIWRWKEQSGAVSLQDFLPRGSGCPCAGGAELPQAGLKGFMPKSLRVFL